MSSAAQGYLDPPFTTAIKWCPVCGRTDRSIPFTGQRHSTGGKRCEGTPVTVVYEFKEVLPVGV